MVVTDVTVAVGKVKYRPQLGTETLHPGKGFLQSVPAAPLTQLPPPEGSVSLLLLLPPVPLASGSFMKSGS